MLIEVREIIHDSQRRKWDKAERTKKSNRLEEIRIELLAFRRENPND